MKNSRLLTTALVLGLSIVLFAVPASAWEFSMDGMYTWEYAWRGQQSNGFFGTYDYDAGANAGVVGTNAPLNFWPGFRMINNQLLTGNDMVSGSDASYNSMYMSTNMQIKMNNAVRVRGNYYIGQWATPGTETSGGLMVNPEYLQMHSPGVQRSFSPGYWRTLWLSAQLPWGEIAMGKRPSSWGMGLSFDGADNRTSESLALSVPYGPLRIQLSFYPARRASSSAYTNNNYDKNNTRVFDMTVPNITYNNGPLSLGVVATWVRHHQGGESLLVTPLVRTTTQNATGGVGVYRDMDQWYASAYMKYNNGRFFLNAEVQTDQQIFRWLSNSAGPQLGASLASTNGVNEDTVNGPTYVEHWGGAVEAGVIAGPTKITGLFALMTGSDTRVTTAGQRRLITNGIQSDTWSNTSVFLPYSYLMVYSYGMGNTRPVTDTREGFVTDATVYAARMDYAAAANLNLFSSFMWAERFSKSGYTWGFVFPVPGTGALTRANSTVAFAPSIPDSALGWEVDAGADWKLLESLTLRTTLAYWQPGKWFNYAYQDKSVPGWGVNTAGASWTNNWLTQPNKTIDAVWGLDMKVEASF